MVGKGVSARHSEMQLMAGPWKDSPGSLQWSPRLVCPQECHKMVIRNGPHLLAWCTSWWAVLEKSQNKLNLKREVRLQFAFPVFPGSSLLFPSFWLMSPIGRSCDWAGISREPWYEAGLAHTRWVIAPSHQPEAAAELGRTGGKLFTVHAVIP